MKQSIGFQLYALIFLITIHSVTSETIQVSPKFPVFNFGTSFQDSFKSTIAQGQDQKKQLNSVFSTPSFFPSATTSKPVTTNGGNTVSGSDNSLQGYNLKVAG